MNRCDDCGEEVADTIGARQCSLFAPADPRIDPHAAEGLRAGRILCPACARGVPLEPLDTPEAISLELADGEADATDDCPFCGKGGGNHRNDCESFDAGQQDRR